MLEGSFNLPPKEKEFCFTIKQKSSGVECRLFLDSHGYDRYIGSTPLAKNTGWEKLVEEGKWVNLWEIKK